jgi:hypothetical protein
MKTAIAIASIAALGVTLTGCIEATPSSDEIQQQQQEHILREGTAQTGMPAIKNFRERKLLKQIIEMRDQDGLVTYTYTVPETTGRPVFLCNSIGYGLPAATQFTNPEKIENPPSITGYYVMPQADPNGLYSPSSAEGTWVLCTDPSGSGKTRPVYVEPRVIVSPFKL